MKNLKLNQLEQNQISDKQLNELKGGFKCGCGCRYVNSGGSSVDANTSANYDLGIGGDKPNEHTYVIDADEVTVRP